MSTIVVRIPGVAWFSLPELGGDPGCKPDSPEMAAIAESANVTRKGKGWSVEVSGSPEELGALATALECNGAVWSRESDGRTRAEGRACLDTSVRIRTAIELAKNA